MKRFLFLLVLLVGCMPASTSGQAIVDRLSIRLTGLGVPLRSVRVTSTSPLAVEIAFTGTRSPTQVSDDVLWHTLLIERVATLAYLDGDRLDHYTVIEVNPQGIETGHSTTNLRPDMPSQQLTSTVGLPPLDDTATQAKLMKRFHTSGLSVTTLSVATGAQPGPTCR